MIAHSVDPVLERVAAVRNFGDHIAHHPLGLILQRIEIAAQIGGTILCEQLPITALTDRTGRKLRADIADKLHRHARVLFQNAKQHLVRHARLVQLHDRKADAFLKNLGSVDGGRASRDAADIAMMGHRAGPAFDDAVVEDRLDDVDVGQVLTAGAIRVVIEKDIAGLRGRRMIGEQDAHAVGERTELHRQRQALRDQLAAAVA